LVGEEFERNEIFPMAKVMICDDDRVMAEGLVAALRAAGHEAETCRHTMDMLRGAAAGEFDLIAFGLDMAGFGRAGAVEALREIAPRVPLIALHERPSEIMRTAASSRTQFAAVLPRSLAIEDFMYAVACALSQPTTRRREPAA
jgi:DNA-binding NtrC family response regulator